MHNQTLRKAALALTFWLALYAGNLRAQLLGPYGTSPTTFEVDADGLLSATGTFGTGTLSLSGTGTRMFWYPGKAAFRAGTPLDDSWDDVNIGLYSVAFGSGTTASGNYSAALGYNANASGTGSFATGVSTIASGNYSTASGLGASAYGNYSTASGYFSYAGNGAFAVGSHTDAAGAYSTASGYYSSALGYCSVASGDGDLASGGNAFAFGSNSIASGVDSMAVGIFNTASGYSSTALGANTSATAFESFSVGAWNIGGGNPTSWVSTDPLFEVGNGASSTPSDALVVYKNGVVAVHKEIRVSAGGDLSMGSFTAGTAP
jgi:hypothetical protein